MTKSGGQNLWRRLHKFRGNPTRFTIDFDLDPLGSVFEIGSHHGITEDNDVGSDLQWRIERRVAISPWADPEIQFLGDLLILITATEWRCINDVATVHLDRACTCGRSCGGRAGSG
jgi:hypothetical protein